MVVVEARRLFLLGVEVVRWLGWGGHCGLGRIW